MEDQAFQKINNSSKINTSDIISAIYYLLLAGLFYFSYFHLSLLDRYLGNVIAFYPVEFLFIAGNFILIDYLSSPKNLNHKTKYFFGISVLGILALFVSAVAGIYFVFYLVTNSVIKFFNYKNLIKNNQPLPKKDIFIAVASFVLSVPIMFFVNFVFHGLSIAPDLNSISSLNQGNMLMIFVANYYLLQSILYFSANKIGLTNQNIHIGNG